MSSKNYYRLIIVLLVVLSLSGLYQWFEAMEQVVVAQNEVYADFWGSFNMTNYYLLDGTINLGNTQNLLIPLYNREVENATDLQKVIDRYPGPDGANGTLNRYFIEISAYIARDGELSEEDMGFLTAFHEERLLLRDRMLEVHEGIHERRLNTDSFEEILFVYLQTCHEIENDYEGYLEEALARFAAER